MQPHLVYLANSAGAKVGITTPTNVPMRWIDQGATQAVLIMRTQVASRPVVSRRRSRATSAIERNGAVWSVATAADRFVALCERLRGAATHALAALDARFPGALAWVERPAPVQFEYPVASYAGPPIGLSLEPGHQRRRNVARYQGQYLMFDSGVFTCAPYLVSCRSSAGDRFAPDGRGQMDLF